MSLKKIDILDLSFLESLRSLDSVTRSSQLQPMQVFLLLGILRPVPSDSPWNIHAPLSSVPLGGLIP